MKKKRKPKENRDEPQSKKSKQKSKRKEKHKRKRRRRGDTRACLHAPFIRGVHVPSTSESLNVRVLGHREGNMGLFTLSLRPTA